MKTSFFFLLFLSNFAFAIETSLSHQQESSFRNTVEGRLLYSPWSDEKFSLQTGAYLRLSSRDVEALVYKAEIERKICPYSWAGLRLNHGISLSDSFTSSHLLPYVKLGVGSLTWFSFYAKFGWYERFSHLKQSLPIPSFFGSSLREHDWAAEFTWIYDVFPKWRGAVTIATFDDIDVYNLNNPFIELRIAHETENKSQWFVFGRYQTLLGFGRRDRSVLGVGWSNLPLNRGSVESGNSLPAQSP